MEKIMPKSEVIAYSAFPLKYSNVVYLGFGTLQHCMWNMKYFCL